VRVKTFRGSSRIEDAAAGELSPEVGQKRVVDGQEVVCAQGAWDSANRWNSAEDATTLEWMAGGLGYRIRQAGLGLDCEDLLHIVAPP
jgi:hypothetical protein